MNFNRVIHYRNVYERKDCTQFCGAPFASRYEAVQTGLATVQGSRSDDFWKLVATARVTPKGRAR